MASARPPATSSPRDHAADANPDLARKKQRIGQDPSRGSSPQDPLLIEADEPEDIGASLENAIHIEDDPLATMDSYSDLFAINIRHGSPWEQLCRLHTTMATNYYVDPHDFVCLAQSLDDHLARTSAEPHVWAQHYLDDEADFFHKFADVAVLLLESADLFEPNIHLDPQELREALRSFLIGLQTLCCRIIPRLPQAIKSTLSRRDSGQVATRLQTLGALQYLYLAFRILACDPFLTVFLHKYEKRQNLQAIFEQNTVEFFANDMVSSLATIIRVLSGAMRELKDAWNALQSTLELFTVAVDRHHLGGKYPSAEVEEVLGVLNACILPAICGKHPRALPGKFHERTVDLAFQAIQNYAVSGTPETALHLYERFIASDIDALLPHDGGTDTSASLWRLVNGSQPDLAHLLATSWGIQASLQFIYSDVMDVRNVGIALLKSRLMSLYHAGRDSPQGYEHPFTQYGVRFLRENELTSYIFGPESRAGLVGHSDNIVCFLAATGFHTDAETDIIWKACSTSVEADFVNASFFVLERVTSMLSFQQLIYIAQKYTTTPMDRLGVEAVRFYEKLILSLSTKCLGDQSATLTLASTMIDMLKVTSISPVCPSTNELRRISMSVIAKFAQPDVSLKDKAEIYRQCVPDIQRRSAYATAAVEILTHLLYVRVQPYEAELILGMLPVTAAVDELCCFVEDKQGQKTAASCGPDVIVRLDCIVHLMILDSTTPDQDATDKLFDHVYGELALCNLARDRAWLKLIELTKRKPTATVADILWKRYTLKRIPDLDAKYATPALLTFIGTSLNEDFAPEKMHADPLSLLSLPLWKTLVRIASSANETEAVDSSVRLILELLFPPSNGALSLPASIVRCQCEFVRSHIQSLCDDCGNLMVQDEAAAVQRFARGIRILDALLAKSKEMAPTCVSSESSTVLVLANNERNVIMFTAQVYGANAHPSFIQIQATQDTKVSELLDKLPEKTLAEENRIIVGGQEISLDPEQTLGDARIRPSGVIMISPKYTFHLDLDEVLTGPGPVEQVIVSQYESLESFLDAPDQIAEQAFDFLYHVRTSAQARMRVTSPMATVEDIFPRDKTWRTRMSLATLQRHLFDFVRLGVADQEFISRALRMLIAVVLDPDRPFDALITLEVARSLCIFFQNVSRQPCLSGEPNGEVAKDEVQNEEVIPHLEEPTKFITRMILLMFEGIDLPLHGLPANDGLSLRTSIITSLYRALLEACRAHDSLWNLVSEHPNVIGLHQSLLLDEDFELSHVVAVGIRDLCRDSTVPPGVSAAYWGLIVPSISNATAKGPLSEAYFTLMSDILPLVDFDEEGLRALIDVFTNELRSYQHTETPRITVKDKAAFGLLKILGLVITCLKSYKKPLRLDGLPTELMRRFLFPPHNDPECRPLTSEESRNLVFDLIKWTFEAPTDYHELVGLLHAATPLAYREIGFRFPGSREFCRAPWDGAGLSNLGMTCYMNSLLQQLFANLQFRKFILDQPISDRQRQSVLMCTQSLFACMQNNIQSWMNTEPLADALKIQTGMQEDVHTFYTALLSKLEESVDSNVVKVALAKFFTGKSITQIKGECGHVSSRPEPFTELSITVKNKTGLVESLDEFVQGEPLEGANKYKCMTCDAANGGRLINAVKRTCLEEVPDNLTCCLKRFTYGLEGEDKVNDRFEFPNTIDVSVYKRKYLEDPAAEREPDIFKLVGVIVHQGSLQFGHYWSYVRVAGTTDVWLYLEDSKVLHCKEGLQDIQKHCFGGPKWANGMDRSDSAYVLFYQRQSYMEEAKNINKVPLELQNRLNVLPEVELPDELARDIDTGNALRQQASSFYGNGFSEFMIWLLGQLPLVLRQRNLKQNGADDGIERDQQSVSDTETLLGSLIAEYMKNILPAPPQAELKMDAFVTAVDTVAEHSPETARAILSGLSDHDGFGWANIVCHDQAKVRSHFFKPIEKCLTLLREYGPEVQDSVSSSLIQSCASIRRHRLDYSRGRWDEYLAFITRLAMLEDGMLLERGYLEWALEILLMRYHPEARKRHIDLWNWWKNNNALELGSLFEFVFTILNEHVDLMQHPNYPAASTGPRTRTPNGWALRANEFDLLFHRFDINRSPMWTFLLSASTHWDPAASWQNYAPGKILGLLVSKYADHDMIRFARDQLVGFFNYEEYKIMPMLTLALHFCLNRADEECQNVMRALTRNLLQWTRSVHDCLWFYEQASASNMAPASVATDVSTFAPAFLASKDPPSRQATAAFLRDVIFKPPPLSDNGHLNIARAFATRNLCDNLQKTVRTAYSNGHARGHYESTMETLQHAKTYMTDFIEAVSSTVAAAMAAEDAQDVAPPLGLAMRVEADEMPAALAGLTAVLDELQDWEPETSLPTRLHAHGGGGGGGGGEVRTSVEGDGESEAADGEVVAETSDDGTGLDELSTSDLEQL